MWFRTFLLFVSLWFITGVAAAQVDDPGVMVDLRSYAYDIEANHAGGAYRTGRTLFGQQIAAYTLWRPAETIRLGLGVFWTLRFGDDPAALRRGGEPYLFLSLDGSGPSQLRFGNLDRGRQALDPILIDRVLGLDRPTDRGVAYRYEHGAVRHDTWIQWRSRNTPEQRESFDVGGDTRLYPTASLCFDLQTHVVHHGGELYSAGIVTDNWAAGAGATWRPEPSDGVAGEIALHGFVSTERRGRDAGRGLALRLALASRGWRVGLQRWWGDGFHAEDGHPYGRADALTSWSLSRRWRVGDLVDGEFAFVGHHLRGDFEQEFWLSLALAGFDLR